VLRNKKANRRSAQRESSLVILSNKTPFSVSEAYKAARTNLMFMLAGDGCKRVVFTSANAAEGKSTTCINMAITFAQTGSKTLVIDADMRKPRVHRCFRIQSSPGLSDILGGFSDVDCLYDTAFENLYVMPAGTIPPNPAELLSSKAMAALLDKLSEQFEYIFIDTPPVDVVTDAAALSRFINGVVLITRYNISTKESTKTAVTALEQAGAEILGFVINDVDIVKSRYGKYKYKYYYEYGYGDNNTELTETHSR